MGTLRPVAITIRRPPMPLTSWRSWSEFQIFNPKSLPYALRIFQSLGPHQALAVYRVVADRAQRFEDLPLHAFTTITFRDLADHLEAYLLQCLAWETFPLDEG